MKKAYLKQKKKLGLLNDAEFFEQLAGFSGQMETDTVKRVYNAMLQIIYTELRHKGAVRLPALCDFELVLSRPKVIRNRYMDTSVFKEAFHQVRINPIQVVRDYFKALDANNKGVVFDPAEKLKNLG